jgi:hypothetical protein
MVARFKAELLCLRNPRTPTKYAEFVSRINRTEWTVRKEGLGAPIDHPFAVLPLDYGVPELVIWQEFGGRF